MTNDGIHIAYINLQNLTSLKHTSI